MPRESTGTCNRSGWRMVAGMGGRSSVDGSLSRRVGELVSHFLLVGVVADVVACRTLCVFLRLTGFCEW